MSHVLRNPSVLGKLGRVGHPRSKSHAMSGKTFQAERIASAGVLRLEHLGEYLKITALRMGQRLFCEGVEVCKSWWGDPERELV